MNPSKIGKNIKKKPIVSISKKKIVKKQTKSKDLIGENSSTTPQDQFWSDKVKFKEQKLGEKVKPKMMPVEQLMKRIEEFENRVAEQRSKGEAFTISFGEVADLVDNAFLFHQDTQLFLRLAIFVFQYFAHVDESFFEVASKLLEASIIGDPDKFSSHYWQGRFHEFQNDYAAARASFEKSLMIKPTGQAYTALGLIHGREQNFREAIRVLLKAIELDPDDITAMINLGSVYLGYEKIDVALKWTKKAIDIDPNSIDALLQYAFLLSENSQIDECIEVFQKALLVSPNNSTIYERMSDAYMAKNDMDKAKEYLDKAYEIDPNNVQIINRVGQFAMAQEDDLHKAMRLFNKGIEINPKDSISYNNMGIAYTETGDLEKAKSYFLKAISLAPETADPRLNYAQVLNQEGNAVEAIATLQGFKATQKRDRELIQQILEALKEQVKKDRSQTWDIE